MSIPATPRPVAVAGRRPRIAYVLRSFPRLSQTHILNEILALQRLGHHIRIFGMVPSNESVTQEGVAEVEGRAEFLAGALRRSWRAVLADQLELVRRHPLRYLRTAAFLARRRDMVAGYTTTTRPASFLQATYLAARLSRARAKGDDIDHLHSHFAHDPTLIALLVSKLMGMTFSFTAHARDMFQIPTSALAERIKHASAVVTICRANVDFLRSVAPNGNGAKVHLVHTGIDVDVFRPAARGDRAVIPVIAVVSRLVEKKGLLETVEALRRVKESGRSFRCIVLGDGPLQGQLEAAIAEGGLADDVRLSGAATQAEVLRLLQSSDLFTLTPFVTQDGDREGLPSSMLEAMACGLPVVATDVAGISEAIVHGETGLLARPHDVAGIAAHLESLLDDEALRRRLGARARAAIVRDWGATAVARELADVFDGASGDAR